MIKEGALTKEPKVDEIYGLHLWNPVRVGVVATKVANTKYKD